MRFDSNHIAKLRKSMAKARSVFCKQMRERAADMPNWFWNKVDRGNTNACWNWQGCKSTRGYGYLMLNRKALLTHRIAYELTHGTIPKGQQICHTCDNPACCNPKHLFSGTMKDNMHDCIKKGRFKFLPKGQKAFGAKLNEAKVKAIRSEYVWYKMGYRPLALKYGVTKSTIQSIIERNTWAHI